MFKKILKIIFNNELKIFFLNKNFFFLCLTIKKKIYFFIEYLNFSFNTNIMHIIHRNSDR